MTGKRIRQVGNDRMENHRADFVSCPNCYHEMKREEWDAAAITLILEPACWKPNSVTVVSECPKCFELSWVHHQYHYFDLLQDGRWPKKWSAAVAALEIKSV